MFADAQCAIGTRTFTLSDPNGFTPTVTKDRLDVAVDTALEYLERHGGEVDVWDDAHALAVTLFIDPDGATGWYIAREDGRIVKEGESARADFLRPIIRHAVRTHA